MFIEIKVCKHCRRLFESVSGAIACPNCSKRLEATFKVVKRYIRSHVNASIFEVAEACETDIEQIKYWIKEERIEYTKGSAMGIECERCGASMKTGRLCAMCKTELVNNLSTAYVKKDPIEFIDRPGTKLSKAKMRYLSKNNINEIKKDP